jgi:hypothetical protein
MNIKRYLLLNCIIAVVMQPVVYVVLSPYMAFVVGLTFDQLVTWWWTALPMGIVLNLVLSVFLGKAVPRITKFVDHRFPN